MAVDARDLDKLQAALNDAASKAAVLWTTFITFELYLAIAFGSITHRDLFLESPVKLPVLNVDLPLVGFFVIAPILLLLFHLYIFLQLRALTATAGDYNTLLRQQASLAADRQYLRRRLDSFLVLQFIAGPVEQRRGFGGFSLRLIAWITVIGAPVLVLLQAQITFLPYHLHSVTWLQRVAVLLSLALAWFLHGLPSNDESLFARVPSAVGYTLAAVATLFVVLFSISVATFPGEPTKLVLRNWHLPFAESLVLTGQTFVDPDQLSKVEVSRSFRGRDLTGAVLDQVDLRKADLTGGWLNEAVLVKAKLQNARLEGAHLQHADLEGADLQGANLDWAQLESATLNLAQVQGAHLHNAFLDDASLAEAQLSGANLQVAWLEGADLSGAQLQGAILAGAHLGGADLSKAQLQGANLQEADLSGVKLEQAGLQGALLQGAELQGASLKGGFLWLARGIPKVDLTDLGDVDTNSPPGQQGDSGLEDWLYETVKLIPADARDWFVKHFDPKWSNETLIPDNYWKDVSSIAPKGEERKRKLAGLFTDLVCRSASIARGLLRSDRVEASGAHIADVVEGLRNKDNPDICSGAKLFTDDGWAQLSKLANSTKAETAANPTKQVALLHHWRWRMAHPMDSGR